MFPAFFADHKVDRGNTFKLFDVVLGGVEATSQTLLDLNSLKSQQGVVKARQCCPNRQEPALCLQPHRPPGWGPTALWDKPTLVVTQPENLLSSSCRHAPPRPIPPSPLLSPPWQPLCFQMFTQRRTVAGRPGGQGGTLRVRLLQEASRAHGMNASSTLCPVDSVVVCLCACCHWLTVVCVSGLQCH